MYVCVCDSDKAAVTPSSPTCVCVHWKKKTTVKRGIYSGAQTAYVLCKHIWNGMKMGGLWPVIIKGVIFLETITLTSNTQVNFAHSACYWRSMPVLILDHSSLLLSLKHTIQTCFSCATSGQCPRDVSNLSSCWLSPGCGDVWCVSYDWKTPPVPQQGLLFLPVCPCLSRTLQECSTKLFTTTS